MNLMLELKNIEEYFNNLSVSDFENVLEKNGIKEISSIEKHDRIFLVDLLTYNGGKNIFENNVEELQKKIKDVLEFDENKLNIEKVEAINRYPSLMEKFKKQKEELKVVVHKNKKLKNRLREASITYENNLKVIKGESSKKIEKADNTIKQQFIVLDEKDKNINELVNQVRGLIKEKRIKKQEFENKVEVYESVISKLVSK